MFSGVEFGLVPAVPTPGRKQEKQQRRPGAWLCGELILRCERQGLTTLPVQLFSKTTVQQLILTGNALTELPSLIRHLQQLRVLKLGHNQLQELPEEVCLLGNLQHLELQGNELQLVPANLCRLVHLEALVLDGNPLQGRFTPQGPTLQELWGTASSSSSSSPPSAGKHSRQQPTGAAGRAPPDSHPQQQDQEEQQQAGGGALVCRSPAACKASTQRLMEYLLTLQSPADALAIKQAKVQQLQEHAMQQVEQLSRRADPTSLEACLAMAQQVGLPEEQVARVRAAQAAVADIQAAMVQEDHTQLGAALRAFEGLCRPGRPDGPVYLDGHAKWRQLQRAALAKGWRCASPAGATQLVHSSSSRSATPRAVAATATAAAAAAAGGGGGGDAGRLGAEGSSRSAGSAGGASSSSASGPRFMTIQQMRKKELQESGAMTYEEWKQRKQVAVAAERQQLTSSIAKEQRKRAEEARARADQALENCVRERTWPSSVAEAYPRGTFSLDGGTLRTVRKAYASPQATARSRSGKGSSAGGGH